jgi:DNA-binding response OmpR family regulator
MPDSRKLVLVVDDDASVRALVVKALGAKGYDTLEAADGLVASELLGSLPRAPDLLICDVMMPSVDGLALAKMLRAKPEFSGLPIIFLTAKNSFADVVQGIQAGARHYVQKPFSVKDLLEKVERTLR